MFFVRFLFTLCSLSNIDGNDTVMFSRLDVDGVCQVIYA